MQNTATDPKVSVPIVCGEYMRATGFFYSTEETIYLVTARHNCIPTDCSQLLTGETDLDTKSSCFSPKIDIYLRTDEETVSKRVNILDRPGVLQIPEIDIVAIPMDFSPDEYGYHLWTEADIVTPQSAGESVETIGFNGDSFPSNIEYDIDRYCNKITKRPW